MKKPKTAKTVKATEESREKIIRTTKTVKEPSVAEKARATKKSATERSRASVNAKKQKAEPLGIRKEYTNSQKICCATFTLPREAAPKAQKVTIVGDFNSWDKEASPLKKLENGDFTITIELDTAKEYRFRYLIDGNMWENDWRADKYVKSPYGVEDSVVCA
jgi:1,4-alpha-glucan branching enzyme